MYAQGSVHDLMTLNGWRDSKVLYIGDNLLSDSVEPRKLFGYVARPASSLARRFWVFLGVPHAHTADSPRPFVLRRCALMVHPPTPLCE